MINNCLIFQFQSTCTLNAFNTGCNPNEIFNSYTHHHCLTDYIYIITVAVITLLFIHLL
uniref:Uncharacterized protein n=1 Tax=Anguilla anguilla TaxID=7936 RepID=A0A0E9XU04_ANGAN